MRNARVVLLCVFAACLYGVVHDQMTVRVCLEYFTIAHPPLFPTASPTLLALCWGIASTAGIGGVLGLALALISNSPGVVPAPVAQLARSIFFLLLAMAITACSAGFIGFALSEREILSLPVGLAAIIPAQQHHRFMAVWFAHGASYAVGLAGSASLCFRLWSARGGPTVLPIFPRTRGSAFRAVLLAVIAGYVVWNRFR